MLRLQSTQLFRRSNLALQQVSITGPVVGSPDIIGEPVFAIRFDGFDSCPTSRAHQFIANAQVDCTTLIPRPAVPAVARAIVVEWHREKPASIRRVARDRIELESQRIDNSVSHAAFGSSLLPLIEFLRGQVIDRCHRIIARFIHRVARLAVVSDLWQPGFIERNHFEFDQFSYHLWRELVGCPLLKREALKGVPELCGRWRHNRSIPKLEPASKTGRIRSRPDPPAQFLGHRRGPIWSEVDFMGPTSAE